jgi:Flp pilus assembly protein TadG
MRVHTLQVSRPLCFRRHRRGSTLIEMGLILPVLLSITFGASEFGYYFYARHAYDNAARDGVRVAALSASGNYTYSNVTSAVAKTLAYEKLGQNYTVTVQDNGVTVLSLANMQAGDMISVTVAGTWGTIGSAFRALGFIGASKTVSGTATMQAEPAP